MRLLLNYEEIEIKIKEITKVSLSLSKADEKTLNVKYSSGIVLVPDVKLMLKINSVCAESIELTYSCNPLMEFAVEKLLPKILSYLPDSAFEVKGKCIKVNLEKIDKLEQLLNYVKLTDMLITVGGIEIIGNIR